MRRREHKSESEAPKPSGMFIKPRVQRKLKIGEANDKYEQEADHVANQVVSQSNSDSVQKKAADEEVQQKPLASEVTPLVQKMEGGEEEPVQKAEEEESVQMMSEEEPVQKAEEEESVQKMSEEEPVQKAEEEESVQKMTEEEPVQKAEEEEAVQGKESTAAGTHASHSVENRINQSKGSGKKLEGKTKDEMESGFGSNFDSVNIHTDDTAAQLSQDLGAKAFTHGNDVYFNKGQYNPESSEGKHLLAHELTHTIQQKGMVQKKEDNTSKTPSVGEPEFDVEIGFNAFIPNTLSAPIYEDSRAWKPEPSPFSNKLFASDNRTYSEKGTSRIWQKGFLKFKGEEIINRVSQQGVGASEQADPIYKIVGYTPIHYGSDTGGNPIKKIVGIKNKKSKTAADKGSVTKIEREGVKGFHFIGEASYPFSSMAPDIDFDISALVKVFKKDDQYFLMAILVGVRDEFPAYQAYLTAGGTTHYFYTYRVDKTDGPGLINLNSTDFIVASKLIKL